MTDWIKKIAGYAPDIAAAIVSGGTTLPATALRIVSKELLGYETDNPDMVQKAINNATPEQMVALQRCNNEFILDKMRIEASEQSNARNMYMSTGHDQADKIANGVMKWNMPLAVLIGLVQIIVLSYFTPLPDMVVLAIGNVSGYITKGLLDERATVCGFYFGSSIGSKVKDSQRPPVGTNVK